MHEKENIIVASEKRYWKLALITSLFAFDPVLGNNPGREKI